MSPTRTIPVVRGTSEAVNQLLGRQYTCVIVDESHRARRRNVPKMEAGPDEVDEKAEPNKLMAFLQTIGPRTKSMLLATATPVQLRPIEAWDLLDVLSRGSESVLGGMWSKWRKPEDSLPLVMGATPPPTDDLEMWQWIRTPLPPRSEHRDFDILRRSLDPGIRVPERTARLRRDRIYPARGRRNVPPGRVRP